MGFTSIPIRNIIREAVARGGIIVDVRDRDEFLEGHIPMAVNIPFELIEAGEYTLPRMDTELSTRWEAWRSTEARSQDSDRTNIQPTERAGNE